MADVCRVAFITLFLDSFDLKFPEIYFSHFATIILIINSNICLRCRQMLDFGILAAMKTLELDLIIPLIVDIFQERFEKHISAKGVQ